MPPASNAWRGWASTARRHWRSAPIARWSMRRWRGARLRRWAKRSVPTNPGHGERWWALGKCAFAHPTKLASPGPQLPVLVHRLALLDERGHAFGTVFQCEGRMEQVALDAHAFRQRRLERAVDGFLGHRGRRTRHRGDL